MIIFYFVYRTPLFSLSSTLAQAWSIFAKKEKTMLDIILSVSLYIGAISLLVKGVINYCETCNE